ncbi:DUF4215 domain-containing protein, partial [Candidatus Dojkabacteria bacterium]|nr:DUF4215 domain-containing protein [Candidatus Dojkabacteria bacterium]
IYQLSRPSTQVGPSDSSAGDYPPPVFNEECSDLAGPGVTCVEDGAYYCETGEGKGCTYKQKCKCTESYNGNIYYQWIDSGDQCADMSECPAAGGGTCTQAECDAAGNGPGPGAGTTSGIYCFCDNFQCSTVNGSQCSNRCDTGCESFTGVLGCGDDPRPASEQDIPLDCFARQIDYYGGTGGYTLCPRSLSGDDCEPSTPPPPTADVCDITVSAACVESSSAPATINDGVSADVSWNVTGENFTIGEGQGRVVIRINDQADGWFTQGSDTYWATSYQDFITSGKNAKSATQNFDFGRTDAGVQYDRIKTGHTYEVWATAYKTPDSTTAICESPKVPLNCNVTPPPPPSTSCGDGNCDTGERCEVSNEGTAFSCPIGGPNKTIKSCRADCTYCGDGIIDAGEQCDDGNSDNGDGCNSSCQTEAITKEPYCGDGVCNQTTEMCEANKSCIDDTQQNVECRVNCTYCGDGELNGDEQCDDGNDNDDDACRNDCSLPSCGDGVIDDGEECDDGAKNGGDTCTIDCKLPAPSDWSIVKNGTPTCTTGKELTAQILYKITVKNNGTGSGEIDRVIDTLDDAVDPTWVDKASISPSYGVLSGNIITWTVPVAERVLQPGESKDFVYKVNVPSGSFGTFTNTAEIIPVSGNPSSVTNQTTVTCSTSGEPLPDTAIFDNMLGRVGIGLLLISISGLYFFMDSTDKVLLRFISKDERLGYEREKFEKRTKK